MQKTRAFLQQFQQETKLTEAWLRNRLQQIEQIGEFIPTTEELIYGAKLAWRNSNKCIGRLFWRSLHVFDARIHVTADAVFEQLCAHIAFATNGGKIRPAVTIFDDKRVRILNHQLIRYAGYEVGDTIIGDPHSVSFTKQCVNLGWQPQYGAFDVLPLVIQINDEPPKFYTIPHELIVEVPITHPVYNFEELALKWYAVPMISDMALAVGDIFYKAAPFNGWYMGTEIGARNFADTNRYNMLPAVAKLLGLDTTQQATLWKDRALVELNIAVLHSFKQHGVSIVDHHTAATQFALFEQQEQEQGRDVTGNWTWLISPMSPATTHVFHQAYNNTMKNPNFLTLPKKTSARL